MGQAVEGPESVALSADGKIMATGAATADGAAGIQSGQVRVMQYDASTSQWEQLGQTIDGVTAGEQFGYSVALASDGLTMAAGAISSSDSGLPQSGNVRVLKYMSDVDQWVQMGQDVWGTQEGTRLGYSVALSGDGMMVAAGAPGPEGYSIKGQVRLLQYDNSNDVWYDLDPSFTGSLGAGVSLSSDGSALAAAGDDETRVLQYNEVSDRWFSLGSNLEGMGSSIALAGDGNIVATGDPSSSIVRVMTYNRLSNMWDQIGQSIYGDLDGDNFGSSVALSTDGSILSASARFDGSNGAMKSGCVRMFRFNNETETWDQLGSELHGENPGDQFGSTLAMAADGSAVAVGTRTTVRVFG
jgi:hypothetical protein